MGLQYQKLGFMICEKIIVYLIKIKAKKSFANLPKLGVYAKVCIAYIQVIHHAWAIC